MSTHDYLLEYIRSACRSWGVYGIFSFEVKRAENDPTEVGKTAADVLFRLLPEEGGSAAEQQYWTELVRLLREAGSNDRLLEALISEVRKFADPAFVSSIEQMHHEIFFSWLVGENADFAEYVRRLCQREEITFDSLNDVSLEIKKKAFDELRTSPSWSITIAGGHMALLFLWLRYYRDRAGLA